MSEPQATTARPDEDILVDVDTLIVHYPPLVNDRHQFHVSVVGGTVTLSGYVKTPMTRRYLIDGVTVTPGVTQVSADGLYDDETLRIEVGGVVPAGVIVNVEYGAVILSGRIPAGKTEADVVDSLRSIPGIRRVITSFK